MVAQLRTYTINRGMMDSWLKVFEEEIRPIHDKIGMPISATFVNADRTSSSGSATSTVSTRSPRRKRPTSGPTSGRPWATSPPATLPRSRSRSSRPSCSPPPSPEATHTPVKQESRVVVRLSCCLRPLPHLHVQNPSLHERVAVFRVPVGGIERLHVLLACSRTRWLPAPWPPPPGSAGSAAHSAAPVRPVNGHPSDTGRFPLHDGPPVPMARPPPSRWRGWLRRRTRPARFPVAPTARPRIRGSGFPPLPSSPPRSPPA